MFRRALGAAAAGVLAVSAAPPAAGAVASRPPRLTGQTLSAQRNWPGTTEPFFLALCGSRLASPPVTGSGNYTATQHFSFHGSATGPYPGTFSESGWITTTFPSGSIPPGVTGTVNAFWMTFRIISRAGSITGSARLAGGGQAAQCVGGVGGTGFTANLTTTYWATTWSATGRRHDHGTSAVGLSSAWQLGEISRANLDESFVSRRP